MSGLRALSAAGCLFSCMLTIGCAASSERAAERIRQDSIARGVCAIHKSPLHSTIVYGYTGGMIIDPTEDYLQLERDFPNALVGPVTMQRSASFTRRLDYRYCNICQDRFTQGVARMSRYDQNLVPRNKVSSAEPLSRKDKD